MNTQLPPQMDAGANAESSADLRDDLGRYVQAWSRLFTHEVQLARTSMAWLFIGTGAIIATALTICITFAALAAFVADHWLHDWAGDIAVALLLEGIALCTLLGAMRRWWRNLSMPRSRAALAHLLGHMQ
ncbi:MAG: hypothetical protein E6K53_06050 [Gammaproteobacteria bacterium]|nr:MAG: hypothetical protein E6K53_06050 [Gammaproteobacteria bacterium]